MTNVIKIELFNQETDKTEVYKAGFLNIKLTMKVADLLAELEAGLEKPSAQFQQIAEIIAVDIFDNQFTADQVLEGTQSHNISSLMEILQQVVEGKKKMQTPVE